MGAPQRAFITIRDHDGRVHYVNSAPHADMIVAALARAAERPTQVAQPDGKSQRLLAIESALRVQAEFADEAVGGLGASTLSAVISALRTLSAVGNRAKHSLATQPAKGVVSAAVSAVGGSGDRDESPDERPQRQLKVHLSAASTAAVEEGEQVLAMAAPTDTFDDAEPLGAACNDGVDSVHDEPTSILGLAVSEQPPRVTLDGGVSSSSRNGNDEGLGMMERGEGDASGGCNGEGCSDSGRVQQCEHGSFVMLQLLLDDVPVQAAVDQGDQEHFRECVQKKESIWNIFKGPRSRRIHQKCVTEIRELKQYMLLRWPEVEWEATLA